MTNAHLHAIYLADLLRREQADMTEFLVALAEFDGRKGWLELGYASLFYFLHRELGLSKGTAHYRKTAAELIRKFPEIVEPLRDGRLCITSIVQVARVLTSDNCREVLPRFFQRSKRDARAVAAALQPAAAPHRDVVTGLRPSAGGRATTGSPVATATSPFLEHSNPAVQPVEPTAAPPAERSPALPQGKAGHSDSAEPLTAELSRLHVTVSKRFLDKLVAARAALSHAQPDANTERILEAGLDLILRRHASRKGLVAKPRTPRKTAGPAVNRAAATTARSAPKAAAVPASVKRQVWTRDGGRCQWPLESGGTCQSPLRVEYDHIIPCALGGPSTAENIRLLCRFHNDLAARRAFGDEWMNRFTRGAPPGPSNAV